MAAHKCEGGAQDTVSDDGQDVDSLTWFIDVVLLLRFLMLLFLFCAKFTELYVVGLLELSSNIVIVLSVLFTIVRHDAHSS